MRATFTAEQEHLAGVAAEMGAAGLAGARVVADGGPLPDEPTASLMAGFAGLGIPEAAGGAGGGLIDVAILVEGLARTVTPTPFVSHAVALQLARDAGHGLAEASAGELRLVAATVPDDASEGVATAVPDGAGAQLAVLVDDHGRVRVGRVASSVPRPGIDPTRPAADLVVEGGDAADGAADGRLRAAVVVAADLCGAGRGALSQAAGYANEREQFGQPIGKFQGVAHQLAAALAYVDAAWSLTLYAAWALAAGAADAATSAHAAKARAGDAAVHAAERALQVHGGIGMTWQADAHLFLRRALGSDGWMGRRSAHRRALGRALLEAGAS